MNRKLLIISCFLLLGVVIGRSEEVFTRTLRKLFNVNPDGAVIKSRFRVPEGYSRIDQNSNSFVSFLQNLPLKPDKSDVLLYNGSIKTNKIHAGVIAMEIGKSDLQQCADACIRLRSEYLFKEKRFNEIAFNFTNGFKAEYPKWRDGYRVVVNGNKCSWRKTAAKDESYNNFRKYLNVVFAYAGTLSLSKEMKIIRLKDMEPGDVFIQGGSPGHAVIVVDVAKNKKTGDKAFLIAQSYMPAQEIHVLKNFNNLKLSPWYQLNENEVLTTPEWDFNTTDLKRF